MNEQLDIRWRQRFDHFEKAFLLLREATFIEAPSIVERAGLILFFEMAFELAWKLLKDFEEAEGFAVRSPREAIKRAFEAGTIDRGHDWIDALEDRNLTTHTYNEETARDVELKIRTKYFPLLEQLHREFSAKLQEKIKEPRLVEHIDRVGGLLYCRDAESDGEGGEEMREGDK